MSAQIITAQAVSDERKLSVSFRLLLGLYSIIPLCLMLQMVDGWFWHGFLRENLPSRPTHFLLFQILFGTPHILASTIVLASNTEYLKFYQRNLIWMTAAIAIVFGVGSLFIPYRVFYVMVAAWTVYHVLKQQHGVARGVCRLPSWAFYLLLWLSVAAGLVVYIGIFLKNSLDAQQTEWIKQIAGLLCAALFLSALYCQRYVTTAFGKWFLWSNIFLVLSSFYLFLQQYYFLAILAPRLVHDATAYIFYVTHDYNRHHNHPQNFIYRYAAHWNLNIFIVLPVCSFALAFVLQAYGDNIVSAITELFFGVEIHKAITLGLLGYFALMHYYTEAFTWKQESPYRRFIAFSK
ncbi:MAG: hypothetical protein LUQ68_01260 [Methylococcaceae bacterium]|nr:hypothetical protein [Methylococcaceae bacterium]OYV23394.1 MAG: hypothetical protein CG442_239 [Methylococcaceae bacterium NSO1]